MDAIRRKHACIGRGLKASRATRSGPQCAQSAPEKQTSEPKQDLKRCCIPVLRTELYFHVI